MKAPSESLRGLTLSNESLAKYTSWRVGGNAERMYIPADRQDLQQFISGLAVDEPVFWLGLGSNLLIRDGGIRGTVINVRGKVKQMKLLDDTRVYVECGVPSAHVARFCSEHGLSGVEFLAGIPGTMGGALKMNAGAFGGETWNRVESVEMMPVGGKVTQKNADKFEVGYRTVKGVGNDCFLAVILKLSSNTNQAGQAKIKKLLAQRAATQPTNQPSCGSVFRNPANDFAARLIEATGLKGYSIGGAEVSQKHANFIVNTGNATAADIEQLIEYVQSEVASKQGVELHTEVCVIGDKQT
ncbi:UDP-N-acetylmuramate dehydrogenase [Bathymodiolus platifrons methanotrophic gill symbiont]|uniref:UDP-N-acetylmuramate dehydrogenase n=1 Tax=Bathymodiolus platifrons methanotrophic gill symbiont TaxID=113268 RepID=UPI000B417127|nr:UDP-N-acetylmuramate dehydrogenase [Bathymodiolus platifrons methanotrophic gill symbiont]TXL00110.1 UDP-N-acetylenolpyruvoylglucosamine reductase [Methylococcaceae bacterium HT1]TXL15811.1 UDP-N-acetylenolpyruvoylglucosamine reductase [Methylococcaceae bacterium HT4]TXL17143.1 UDP-N-acetylenolpyruvoylglucosamine reductase [Methylococcaceae bacterium HT3]TXL21535.1 UDP-N-acetylenolpyruvoylglucosamine reductase [Methylococcaceae bacterium HT5]TXL23615.1 UDP-N-acetylenolpyruvoylglucosamine re